MSSPVVTWQAAVAAGGRDEGADAIAGRALAALAQELPVLREDPDLLEAARNSTVANIGLVVQMVQGTITLGQLEAPPQAAAFTRELARRNVPVAELDRAYRVAQLALWRWAVGQVHDRVEGDLSAAIEGLSEAVFATGDVFSATVMQQYALERERWLRSADAIRATTLQEVLGGVAVDTGAAGARLGYELRQAHEAYVVWATGDGNGLEDAAARIGGGRALVSPLGVGVIAGWAPEGTLDTAAAGSTVHVAVGAPGTGIEGFRRSHLEAGEARRVARLLHADAPVTRYDDVALLALLTRDLAHARRFAQRTLGPLAADDRATVKLADTLHAALEEQGSPRRTAHRLGVHENTVAKRLRAIDGLLGGLHRHRTGDLLAALTILTALRVRDDA